MVELSKSIREAVFLEEVQAALDHIFQGKFAFRNEEDREAMRLAEALLRDRLDAHNQLVEKEG